MKTKIFPCQDLADSVLADCKTQALAFRDQYGREPKLCVVLVGEDPASKIYVDKKSAMCRAHSIGAHDIRLPAQTSQQELEKIIHQLNEDNGIDGILVQSPLPKGLDEKRIQALILPTKDVDCFHPENVGQLMIDATKVLAEGLPPCTPAGVMEVLAKNKITVTGKRAVVLGRSNIVGKPMALMLLAANATVTICHSKTKNLAKICSEADILVSAIGRPRFVKKNMVKKGAALIDVGINRISVRGKNKVVGDLDSEKLQGKAAFLTPVPKGIGPMTIAMLIRNTVRAAWLRAQMPKKSC